MCVCKRQRRVTEDWSNICKDILTLIVDEFSAIEDIFRFGAVCRLWRSVSIVKRQLPMVYPWLMLAEKEDSDSRGFYSLSTQKVYHMNLPEARGRRCWSSYGWLITFGIDLEIHLLNPFSRFQIRLPPLPTLPHRYPAESMYTAEQLQYLAESMYTAEQLQYPAESMYTAEQLQYPAESMYTAEQLRQFFIKRMVLSSTPSSLSVQTTLCKGDVDEKLVVMAISSQFNKLTFLRLGDIVWTDIKCPNGFHDVICFSGQFYAVGSEGILYICDISSPQPTTTEFAGKPEERFDERLDEGLEEIFIREEGLGSNVFDYFLVESLGELFMVAEIYSNDHPERVGNDDSDERFYRSFFKRYETVGFDVYKFNFDYKKWILVKSLDDRALFVGNNTAFAIFPSDQHPGCEPNCIYFTDSCVENLFEGGGHDMGVFRMETRKFESHYVGPDFFSYFCTPLGFALLCSLVCNWFFLWITT